MAFYTRNANKCPSECASQTNLLSASVCAVRLPESMHCFTNSSPASGVGSTPTLFVCVQLNTTSRVSSSVQSKVRPPPDVLGCFTHVERLHPPLVYAPAALRIATFLMLASRGSWQATSTVSRSAPLLLGGGLVEGAGDSVPGVADAVPRNHDPDGIDDHKVDPEVAHLGAGVLEVCGEGLRRKVWLTTPVPVIKGLMPKQRLPTPSQVEHHSPCCSKGRQQGQAATELTLQVTGGVVEHIAIDLGDADDDQEGVPPGCPVEQAPDHKQAAGAIEEGSDGLHGDDKGVAGGVARVGVGVLLPDIRQERPRGVLVEGRYQHDIS